MKKCKEGHYYCFQDSKCKPIPKGYRRGVGGYLRREREDEKEDSKKNGNGNGKSNGSSNGNGNGGNGGGNGNGGSGGNGGGNGSGGVGESVEIKNSDGETTAVVVDIVGPAHMKPAVDGNGVWKGTNITEVSLNPSQFLGALQKAKKMSRISKMNQAMVDANKTNGDPNLTKSDSQVTQVGDQAPMDSVEMAKKSGDTGVKTKKQLDTIRKLYPGAIESSYEPEGEIVERKMTEDEKEKKEDIVKGMKKDKKGFKKRYGKDAKSVMYATATKLAMEEKHKDHEPEMIRSQLKTAKRASKKIKKHTLKKDNFKAWVQSKITKASDYLDTAADYLDSKDDMKEELDKKDKPYIKKLVKNLRKGSKTHAKQADKLEKAVNEELVTELSKDTLLNYTRGAERGMKSLRAYANLHGRKKEKKKIVNREKGMDRAYKKIVKKIEEESNPRIPRKKGQPANSKKHSDLYTDENPKGTIHGLGFKDVATAKASVSKIRNSSRSHAHKIQAAVAMEQRAREMGKTSEAAVYRKFINSMKKKTKD